MTKDETELFVKQVYDQISKNSDLIDHEVPLARNCAWQNLYQATRILFKCIDANSDWAVSSVDTCCCILITNTLSDILNALLSTVHGFYRGPGVILRSAVENLAVTVVIKKDKQKFTQYIDGKLNANETIKPAKELFSEIGRFYGLLSNTFVHERFETLARNMEPVGKDVDFSLLPKVSTSELPAIILMISYLSRFSGALAEYCLAAKLQDFYYWRKISDRELRERHDNFEDKLINELADHYQLNFGQPKITGKKALNNACS